MIGQTLIAAGLPFVFNMPSKLATAWFLKRDGSLITLAGMCMFIIGCFLSFLWPYICIKFTNSAPDKVY